MIAFDLILEWFIYVVTSLLEQDPYSMCKIMRVPANSQSGYVIIMLSNTMRVLVRKTKLGWSCHWVWTTARKGDRVWKPDIWTDSYAGINQPLALQKKMCLLKYTWSISLYIAVYMLCLFFIHVVFITVVPNSNSYFKNFNENVDKTRDQRTYWISNLKVIFVINLWIWK